MWGFYDVSIWQYAVQEDTAHAGSSPASIRSRIRTRPVPRHRCRSTVLAAVLLVSLQTLPAQRAEETGPRDVLLDHPEDLLMALAVLQRSRLARGGKMGKDGDILEVTRTAASAASRACQSQKGVSDCAHKTLDVHGNCQQFQTCLSFATTVFTRALQRSTHNDTHPHGTHTDASQERPAREEVSAFQLNSSTLKVLDQQHPRGHCLWTTRFCPIHPELSGLMVDESLQVYDELSLLPDDDARKDSCLSHAENRWRSCGHVRDSVLSMIWRQEGYSLMDSPSSTFPQDGECGNAQRGGQLHGTRQPHSRGGWKHVHVWVEGSTYSGREQAPNIPPDVLARELLRDDALGLLGKGVSFEDLSARIRTVTAQWTQLTLADMNDQAVPQRFPSLSFHAQLLQDSWVTTIFGGKQGGFFVDLAAHEAIALSNTVALERDYGWSGICIEPNHTPLRGLAYRACTVVSAVVTNETGRRVSWDTSHDSAFAGVVAKDTALQPHEEDGVVEYKQVGSVSLGKILKDMQAPATIDYLSLDIEGSEHIVLESFPWAGGERDGYSVLVITIEHPDLCSRSVLRREGFHFLSSLEAQDEIWVHESLVNFSQVMAQMGSPEPLSRRKEWREQLREKCHRLALNVARDSFHSWVT
jgi:hypothetical protein